jgi:hypothetical protein
VKYLISVLTLLIAGNSIAFGAPAPTPTPVRAIDHTPYGRVHRYIVSEYALIRKDVHNKKLTAAQGKTLLAQVKAVQTQEKGFVKTNGSKTLTDSQAVTLTRQLETLSKSIPIK